MISTRLASVKPACLTVSRSDSATFPRVSSILFAKRTAASRFESLDVPIRLSEISFWLRLVAIVAQKEYADKQYWEQLTCDTTNAMPSLVFESKVFVSAPWRHAQPVKA